MSTFGFLGTGNMGGAVARAVARVVGGEKVVLLNRTPAKAEALAAALGAQATRDVGQVLACDYVFLGVKPQMMEDLLHSISPLPEGRVVLVTMAAGWSIARFQGLLGNRPMIRIMPNTPVAVGEGAVLYCCSPEVTAQEEATFLTAMGQAGLLEKLPEHLIDAGSAVSGCGPAYAYLFLEALADGGVACGLPRQTAQTLAAQMLLGAAKLALSTPQHPAALKDAVCSPGGTTIQGVRKLEEHSFRAAAMEAVIAAFEKNKAL